MIAVTGCLPHRGGGGMAGSSVELGGRGSSVAGGSLGPGRRSRTPLTDLDAKFVTKVRKLIVSISCTGS